MTRRYDSVTIYISDWLLYRDIRRYLLLFSDERWQDVIKYTFLIGLSCLRQANVPMHLLEPGDLAEVVSRNKTTDNSDVSVNGLSLTMRLQKLRRQKVMMLRGENPESDSNSDSVSPDSPESDEFVTPPEMTDLPSKFKNGRKVCQSSSNDANPPRRVKLNHSNEIDRKCKLPYAKLNKRRNNTEERSDDKSLSEIISRSNQSSSATSLEEENSGISSSVSSSRIRPPRANRNKALDSKAFAEDKNIYGCQNKVSAGTKSIVPESIPVFNSTTPNPTSDSPSDNCLPSISKHSFSKPWRRSDQRETTQQSSSNVSQQNFNVRDDMFSKNLRNESNRTRMRPNNDSVDVGKTHRDVKRFDKKKPVSNLHPSNANWQDTLRRRNHDQPTGRGTSARATDTRFLSSRFPVSEFRNAAEVDDKGVDLHSWIQKEWKRAERLIHDQKHRKNQFDQITKSLADKIDKTAKNVLEPPIAQQRSLLSKNERRVDIISSSTSETSSSSIGMSQNYGRSNHVHNRPAKIHHFANNPNIGANGINKKMRGTQLHQSRNLPHYHHSTNLHSDRSSLSDSSDGSSLNLGPAPAEQKYQDPLIRESKLGSRCKMFEKTRIPTFVHGHRRRKGPDNGHAKSFVGNHNFDFLLKSALNSKNCDRNTLRIAANWLQNKSVLDGVESMNRYNQRNCGTGTSAKNQHLRSDNTPVYIVNPNLTASNDRRHGASYFQRDEDFMPNSDHRMSLSPFEDDYLSGGLFCNSPIQNVRDSMIDETNNFDTYNYLLKERCPTRGL